MFLQKQNTSSKWCQASFTTFWTCTRKKTQNDLKEETLGGMSFHWFRARIGNVGIFVASLTDPHIEALILAVLKIATTRQQKRNDEMRTVSVNSSTNAKISGEKNLLGTQLWRRNPGGPTFRLHRFLATKDCETSCWLHHRVEKYRQIGSFPPVFWGVEITKKTSTTT